MRDVTKYAGVVASAIGIAVAMAAAMVSGAGTASAQAAAANTAAVGDTELETVVVTAQKRSEDIQTVGVSIQAFTGKALEELGVKSSADIAQFASNVEIALPSGAGNQPLISIRGIGLNEPNGAPTVPNRKRRDLVGVALVDPRHFERAPLVAPLHRDNQAEGAVHRRPIDDQIPPLAHRLDKRRQPVDPVATGVAGLIDDARRELLGNGDQRGRWTSLVARRSAQ